MKKSIILISCLIFILIFVIQSNASDEETVSTPDYQVNNVLDTYQTAFKNENIDQVIDCIILSFC